MNNHKRKFIRSQLKNPHYSESDYEAEKYVLGGMIELSDPDSTTLIKVVNSLTIKSFYHSQHKVIFGAICSMVSKRHVIDLLTLSDQLERNGSLEDVGGLAYLTDLQKSISSTRNIYAYVRIIHDAYLRRELYNFANSIMAEVIEQEDLIKYIGQLASGIEHIRSNQLSGNSFFHISKFIEDWENVFKKRFYGEEISCITTGIDKLDTILAPVNIPNGSLVAVGARPKMGKTSFLIKIAEHVAMNLNLAVISFSLEMAGVQLTERMLASKSGVPNDVFYQTEHELQEAEEQGRQGPRNLFNAAFKDVDKAIQSYQSSFYYVDDKPNVTIEHIESQARLLSKELQAKEQKLGLIMVDYLTLVQKGEAERNDLAYAEITRRLKLLAKELDCVVFLVTQLNRRLEERLDKRPMPSDSRDTGQIEQDCDIWIGLYRDSFYHKETEQGVPTIPENLMEIIVRLNRHGSTGTAGCCIDQGRIRPYNGVLQNQNPMRKNVREARGYKKEM